jgi:hypothetical protein|tara:strand:+ start:227 stop:469 length:243 start_codon:yes stop_codon:yes gene_type:complete
MAKGLGGRASSSINEGPSMFMTEPPSSFKNAVPIQMNHSNMVKKNGGGYPHNNFSGMSGIMRASNFGKSTQAESNTAYNS